MIIPALDLLNGNVVRLYQGNYLSQRIYSENPIKYIEKYQKQGAKFLHLVDLNGAKNPKKRQKDLLKNLIFNTSLSIQVGGGIRNIEDAKFFFQAGAKRIVISSIILKPKIITELFKEYGSKKIVLALDVQIDKNFNYIVFIHGWHKKTNISIEKIIEKFLPLGLKNILCTDIKRDGTLKGTNIDLYKKIKNLYPEINLQSSGGVGSIKDLINLKNTGINNVIIGRALLENKFTLKEAISCWQNV